MKTIKRLLLTLAVLVLAGYSTFMTIRVRQSEARVAEMEVALPSTPVMYAFDDSFMQHFGQRGVEAVNKVVRRGVTEPDQVVREVNRELKVQ